MNKPTPNLSPELILEIILKRRWMIIIPFIISLVAGIYLALTLPKVYQATTLILVQPQRVPTDFVRSLVSSDINERISTISQQIMSQTNLQKIIDQFKLFSEPEAQSMFLEDKIENLRNRITVNITSDRKKDTDAFAISFKGQNPERVMRITNTLATFFINENLKVREAQAIGTSDFLQDELNSLRKRLAGLEETLRVYRMEHMGALPEQLETNLRVLERLQEELNASQLRLRDARQFQISLEKQIADDDSANKAITSTSDLKEARDTKTSDTLLASLQRQLTDLQTRYTNRHPDIIRLKKQISDLEAAQGKASKSETSDTTENSLPDKPEIAISKTGRSLNRQMEATLREISQLEYEIPKIIEKIKSYQERVEQTPKIEQELLSLRRDYDNIKASYDSLLHRKMEAELAVNMEKKQKGEQFQIIDPARVPSKPLEPDMRKLFLITIGAGLAVGAGIVFLFEYLDRSFKSPDQIEAELGCKVLAMIPALESQKTNWRKRVNLSFTIVSLVVALSLLSGFASLTLIGERQTKEFVRMILPS